MALAQSTTRTCTPAAYYHSIHCPGYGYCGVAQYLQRLHGHDFGVCFAGQVAVVHGHALPFVAWLVINLILKLAWPRMALRGTELLVIYSMSWIVGTVSASGWTTYWGGIVSTPFYYASPENRWEEVLFDILPWWCLPQAAPEIIRTYYEGLPDGASIPWRGWLASLHWWFAVSIALVVAGLCLAVIFQKQWEENERLTFPLAAFPIALTEGFDEPGRVIPGIFRNKLFWVGFLLFSVFLSGIFSVILPLACLELAFTTVI